MPLSDLSRQILQKNLGRGTVYSIREDPEYIQGIEQVTVQRPEASGTITPELPEQPRNQIDGILETINQENLQKQQESESQKDFERSLKLTNPEHVDEIDKLLKRGEHPDIINAVVKAKQKKGLLEAFKGGREESVSGLAERTLLGKGAPEPYIPENRIEELVKLATTMGYDLPYFIAGSLAGLFGGPAAPIVGGAGAMALPTFLRQSFLEYLDAGGDKKSFLEKVSNVAKETGKSAVIGAATAGVGKALPFGLKTTGEIATITGVSSGLEQKLPTLEDFENNALMLVGIKAGARVTKAVSEALKNRYEKTGELPQDVKEVVIDDEQYTRELPLKEASISTQLTVRKTPEAQINYLKTLGYPDEEIIKMSGKDRQYLIDNQVTYKEQELKKWGMEAKEPSAFPREHEGMTDIEQIPRTKAEITEQDKKEGFKIGQRPAPKVSPREHEEIGEELISEPTPEIIRPKKEVKLPELIEIEDKAKSLSQRDFTDYYIKKMGDLFNETNDKYQVVTQYFSKLTEGRNAAQEIWDKLNGVNKTVYENKNINVNVLNGEILKELNPESKNIIKSLSEFTQEKYPQKQLTVNIGKQPISIAGEKGFRITVPTTEGEINDMFPYDKSVIPSYKELESKGMTRQELWAGHDWFHELGHTLGIKNEKEADLFAIKTMNEWFKWKELPPKIQPIPGIKPQTAQERPGEVKTEEATVTPPKEAVLAEYPDLKQPSATETVIRYEETSKTGLPSQKDYFASSTVHQIGKNTGRILLQSPNPKKSAEELFNIIINNKTSNDEYAVKASEEIKKTRDKADLLNDTVEVSSIIARKDFRLQRKGYKQPSAEPKPAEVKPEVPPGEAGFLSLGKAKSIRPTTSNPKALAYQKMLDEENIVARKLAHKTLKERFESFKRNWIDASINLRKKLESLGPEGVKVLDRFILRKGTMAEAERILKEVDDEIFGGLNRAEFDLVANVVQAKRTIAIDAYKTDVKHPEGMGADFAQEFLASFPGKDAQLNKAIDRANLLFEKQQQILDMLYKEGLINFESLEALLSKGDYSLRRFIQHIDPEHIYDFGQGNPISITSSGIEKLAHGSEQLLLKDPRYLFQQTLIRSLSRIFKNRANQELYNLASTNPDNGIVRAIRSNEDVPAGYQKISVVVDGAKKDMIMPNKYAREWIQSDPEISNNLANWLGWISGAKILRPMATGINPEFTLTNIPRDTAHILLTTTEYSSTLPIGLGQLTKDLIMVLPDVIHRRGRWIEHIKEGGGFHNSFTKQGLELTKNLGGDAGKFVNYLSWLGNFSEDITRIAMRERAYKNAKSKGMNDVDAKAHASAVARDYLDFSQGGLHSKALDNVLPYFNAGIQGTRGIFRAARRDKGVFAYKIAQLGGLATGLYLANSFNNPDAMNQISDREKVNNWIITTPFKYKDKDGNERYLYFKIAKDQGQRIFATIFENIVAKLKGDKINMTQISQASDALINVLPSSGTGIPTVDAILGYVLNKDLWRNEDIWKGADVQPGWEQTKYTHPLLAKLGEKTGIISPERTKYALQRIFTYRNIYTDMVSGGLSAFFKEMPEQVKEKTMQEITSSAPFARRFIGTTYPQVITKEAGQKEQIEENTRRQKINLDFDELIDKYIVETKPENDIIPKGRIEDFIKQQSKADQVRLKLRFKKTIKLYDLPDRKWWIDLSYLSPTVRAHQFWKKYKDSGEDKKKQMHEILKKGVAPGVRSKEFLDELEKIGKP